jgi:hypothetical protein
MTIYGLFNMANTKFASIFCGEGPLFNLISTQIQVPSNHEEA